ncbi:MULTISPECIES: sensor histidine kinase [Nocardioides]|uniref:Sensor-like histidine kinase SenX3 n=1 Tax=Nocardioides vastitatis TaxID=2568655 RepID=A0ABW0ZCW9_9ACTN|nr:HAMP domain-containing sensor histidine kinase [Nocardioides sp.]
MTILAPKMRSSEGIATATQLVVFPVVLGAAVLLYLYFRGTESGEAGWLTLCLTVYAVQGATLAGLRTADVDFFVGRPEWVLLVHLPVGILVLTAVVFAARAPLRVDPMVAGLVLGLFVAACCVAANRLGPELPMTSPPMLAVDLVLVLIAAAIAHAALRLRDLPSWCVRRLAVGTVALVVNQVAISQPAAGATSAVAVVAGVTAAVCMASAAAAVLRWALLEQSSAVVDLSESIAEIEASNRHSRARLHEITNSIAGIAAASSLINRHDAIRAEDRRRLEEMLESESNRLARLLGGNRLVTNGSREDGRPHGSEPRLLDVDQVIRPLITGQKALGRRIHWRPSAEVAVGDADAVAEVISILLDNAARHAPDSETVVEVVRTASTVEIAVRDDGPGIPAEVRRRLFEWGGRGPDSNGQGIGLHLAHQLMSSRGSSLRLDLNGIGTTFVVGLPLPPEDS